MARKTKDGSFKSGERVLGPYGNGGRWLVAIFDAEGGRSNLYFERETEAKKAIERIQQDIDDAKTKPISEAIEEYETHMVQAGNKQGSCDETGRRLRLFFQDAALPLRSLSAELAQGSYDRFRDRKRKDGKPISVDYHRNTLAEAKTFLNWCVGRKWLKTNPLLGVAGTGRRNKGKPQLRIDEVRRWNEIAFGYADDGEAGAIAALMTLYLDMRCTEILNRAARDLDDGGRLIWTESKTSAGKRKLEVPERLRTYLLEQADGKAPSVLLFGYHDRGWVRHWVRRICKEAGVPFVCAHSMRGLHASLAAECGTTGHLIALAMGHESAKTTLGGNYATASAVAKGKQKRMMEALDGENSTPAPKPN